MRLFLNFLFAVSLAPLAAFAQTNVTTQHNDNGRTGQNVTETVLTPAALTAGNFGKLYTVALDGRTFAQPLYMASVLVAGTNRSVVFVATTHDSVYAIDAKTSGNILWKASLLDAAHGAPAGSIPDPESDTGCGDVDNSEYGIMGTPVIDTAAGTMYVVSRTYEGNYPVQRLHALDIATGNERSGSPVTITASAAGTGVGSSNGVLTFDPKWENQRPGLLLINGTVYIGWGSHCDSGPWHGWILGYSTGTLAQSFVYNASANGASNGIWLSGMGLAADTSSAQTGTATARLFTATGNGTFNLQTGDMGESVLNLNLAAGAKNLVTDYFTPSNQAQLTNDDEDLGAAGPILLPDSAGTTQHPHLAVQLSKAGTMYLLDRDKLGGYNTAQDQNIQDVQFGPYSYGIWGGPAYFNQNLYFWAANGSMQQFSLTNGLLSTTPVALGSLTEFGTNDGYYNGTFQGATPSVSANGVSNGIVWVDDTVRDQGNPIQYLYAFDATSVSNVLWSSKINPTRDSAGGSQKFAVPTIADGRVFLASQTALNIYGILPPGFTLSTNPAAATVGPGASISIQVKVSAISGFSGTYTFAAAGLPAGVTAQFSPNAAGALLTLTASASAAVTAKPAAVTVNASSGALTSTAAVQLYVATTVQPVSVPLAASANVAATSADGSGPSLGGLDAAYYAYSSTLLGSTVSALGVTFTIGASNAYSAVSSAEVSLTAGQFGALNLLGTATITNQPNQTIIVTYTDGTSTSFTQSMSDWGASQKYAGETIAQSLAYRISPNGTKQNGPWNIYAYSFALNAAKTVRSVVLPHNRNVSILAMTLSGQVVPSAKIGGPALSLASVANVNAIAADGTAPANGGLDGAAYSFSSKLTGSAVVWSGISYPLSSPTSPTGVSNAVVPLPAGNYGNINILATGIFGGQPNQSFVVTYTDGTTSTFVQSVSDWGSPQKFAGESTASTMAYRVTPNGSTQAGSWNLYGYSFALNNAKTVSSIQLPKNRSVVVLGISLTQPVVNVSAIANVVSSATDATAPAQGGLDGYAYAYSAKLLGSTLTWSGTSYPIGGAATKNAVSTSVVALPSGNFSTLSVVATAVNGAQPNQSFVVTYTDGSATKIVQSLSDWGYPQKYAGESVASSMAYRLTPTGTTQTGSWNVYGYTLTVDPTKSVQSLSLPNNRNVVVLGISAR